jgi:hypothetical protein
MAGMKWSPVKLLLIIGLPVVLLAALLAYWSFSENAQVDACQDQ